MRRLTPSYMNGTASTETGPSHSHTFSSLTHSSSPPTPVCEVDASHPRGVFVIEPVLPQVTPTTMRFCGMVFRREGSPASIGMVSQPRHVMG